MSLDLTPLRGEVWDAHVPRVGPHPFVIRTTNVLLARLSSATAVLVTGTPGPRSTHVVVGANAGLVEHDESCAVATELHQVALAACRRQRGRLSPSEMCTLEQAIRTSHGLLE